jgi:ribosomal protein S18 acetylase RimI-like enzyme
MVHPVMPAIARSDSPARAPAAPNIGRVPEVRIQPIPLAQTRELRRTVLRPYQTLEELASHEPENAFAVGAFDGGELISVGFIGPDPNDPDRRSWRIRGMATIPEARGSGAGTKILDALMRHATEQGATHIWCNARTPARSLYERAGLRVTSEQFELPRIGPHYVMEWDAGNGADSGKNGRR